MRALLALVLLAVAASASAQPDWRPVPDGPSVSVDALLALGDDLDGAFLTPDGRPVRGADIGVVSSAFAVGGRLPVGGRWAAVAELPFSYARFSTPDVPALGVEASAEDDLAVGNPYVGVEGRVKPGLAVGGGVRLPLARYGDAATSFAWQGGYTADAERFEAYLPQVLTVSASARYEPSLGPVRLRLRLAPAFLTDVSGEAFFGDPDPARTGLALGYSALVEAGAGALAVSGGVLGRPIVAGERFELFDATAALALGARVRSGPAQPGVLLRVPLDRDRFYLGSDATVGLSLDVPLR